MDATEQKALLAGVFDRAAETYDRTGVAFFGPIADALVELAAPRPGERVLDVGCGRGAAALRAARAVGPEGRVVGVDLSPAMVAGLLEDAAAAGLTGVEGYVGDAERPSAVPAVASSEWDVVLAANVLFFLPDLDAALLDVRSLLGPDGRLAISWFGPDTNAEWAPVWEALMAEVPEDERPVTGGADEAWSGVEALTARLHAAGFAAVDTVDLHLPTVFRDDDEFWRYRWSHTGRLQMEALADRGLLERATARVSPLLDRLRADDGSLSWSTHVRLTVAR